MYIGMHVINVSMYECMYVCICTHECKWNLIPKKMRCIDILSLLDLQTCIYKII